MRFRAATLNLDRCIDFIWVSGVRVIESRVCFDQPDARDPSLWPSDHAGVQADLEVEKA